MARVHVVVAAGGEALDVEPAVRRVVAVVPLEVSPANHVDPGAVADPFRHTSIGRGCPSHRDIAAALVVDNGSAGVGGTSCHEQAGHNHGQNDYETSFDAHLCATPFCSPG